MTTTWRDIVGRVGIGALVVAAVALTLGVAWLVPQQPLVAVGVALVVLVAIAALVNPVTLPLLAMPLIVVVARVGGGGVDLTLSDVMLALAFWPAVLLSPRPFSKELRALLWLNAVYQVLTLFTLIANPFLANTVDWFHNWLLVSGALIVGWAVGRSGAGRTGTRLFLAATAVLAVLGLVEAATYYVRGDFAPLYPTRPFDMHKNYFGSLMSFAALMLYARPAWLGLSRTVAHAGFWLCVAALGVSQSRQAIVALAVGLVLVAFKGRHERGRGWLSIFLGIPALAVVATLVRDQIASGNQHNSYFQRLEWYDQSIANWQTSPWFGLGLRYWTEGRGLHNFHPPQVFLEVLATTGVVGLLGFVVMAVGMIAVLWRVPGVSGALALSTLVARLVQGQFDIFWLSPTTSIPFLLIGVLLGVLAMSRTDELSERQVAGPAQVTA
ncbi:O-antigen ligase family protein [Ornithinimicrobium avium]|uniref:O-antigen ligase family protein n=1 Tax=Ornithinimicrobium avium TaxID=2283195 RepID=A0A345NPC4_9MICO|nr:O-antigen ligase family protein [Ornithinimicrobium avium]AXH96882.1 O-antigen ligase family protein [Ornithinimicrobium avium]